MRMQEQAAIAAPGYDGILFAVAMHHAEVPCTCDSMQGLTRLHCRDALHNSTGRMQSSHPCDCAGHMHSDVPLSCTTGPLGSSVCMDNLARVTGRSLSPAMSSQSARPPRALKQASLHSTSSSKACSAAGPQPPLNGRQRLCQRLACALQQGRCHGAAGAQACFAANAAQQRHRLHDPTTGHTSSKTGLHMCLTQRSSSIFVAFA